MTRRRAAYWSVVALTLAIYGAMVGWTLPGIMREAGGLTPFDLRPMGYTVEQARAFLAALGTKGRDLYLGPQHLLDLFYPPLLAAVLIGAVRALIPWLWLQLALALLALGGMTADYVENTRVAAMLLHEGPVPAALVAQASWATQAKSLLTSLVALAVCAGVARAVWMKWRR